MVPCTAWYNDPSINTPHGPGTPPDQGTPSPATAWLPSRSRTGASPITSRLGTLLGTHHSCPTEKHLRSGGANLSAAGQAQPPAGLPRSNHCFHCGTHRVTFACPAGRNSAYVLQPHASGPRVHMWPRTRATHSPQDRARATTQQSGPRRGSRSHLQKTYLPLSGVCRMNVRAKKHASSPGTPTPHPCPRSQIHARHVVLLYA